VRLEKRKCPGVTEALKDLADRGSVDQIRAATKGGLLAVELLQRLQLQVAVLVDALQCGVDASVVDDDVSHRYVLPIGLRADDDRLDTRLHLGRRCDHRRLCRLPKVDRKWPIMLTCHQKTPFVYVRTQRQILYIVMEIRQEVQNVSAMRVIYLTLSNLLKFFRRATWSGKTFATCAQKAGEWLNSARWQSSCTII